MTRRHSLPLACAALATLLPLAAQSPDPDDLAGKWMTSFGPMTLEASRKSLSGTYGFEGTSQIEGVVDRDGLRLNWRHSRASGRFEIELWDDGDHFVGTSVVAGGQEEFFAGYRMAPELPKPARGEVVRGQSTSGLNFHLRAPKKWNKRDKTPALVILHGSNMTAADYVGTIAAAWPKLAERYVLVGFDGEHMSRGAKPDAPAFNYTYVNFSGPGVGEPGRYNQTPGLLAAAMEELQKEYDFAHYVVGGHSQGGFLTWVMALHYPELVKGAFPMSCNLLVQCEPDYFDDAKQIAQQHRVALAPIHGENDPVVAFSGSEYATRRMVDGGFPKIHFFTDPHAAHMFARLPVPAAIEWIENMACTDDAGDVLDFAAACLDAGDTRDAIAALARAEELGLKSGEKRTAKALDEQLTELVEPEATELLARIREDADNGWVDDFLDFRRRFGTHEAAEPVMAAYAKLRNEHQKPADELFYAARGLQDATARNAKYREILQRYYASKWYESVKGWID